MSDRTVPRPFTMHWGGGQIIEEASYQGQYHEPAIQLLKFDDGSTTIRFCYYSDGRFQRSPLMVSQNELPAMKAALKKTPKLRALLKKLVKE